MMKIFIPLIFLVHSAFAYGPAQNTRIMGDNGDSKTQDVYVSSHNLKVEIAGVTTGDDGAPGTEGYLPVEIYDMQEGKEAQITPLKEIMVSQRTRAIGSTFINGYFDFNFWSSATVTTGQISVASGSVILQASTSAVTNGITVLQTLRTARFVTGSSNEFRAIIRITTAIPTSGTNDMRWGLCDAVDLSTTSLMNGLYFKWSNGAFYVGARLNGTAMEVSTPSFNGKVPTITENYTRYQIVYTNIGASFYVNDFLAHKMSPTNISLTASVNFKARAQNINSGGSSAQNIMEAKVITVNRLGMVQTIPLFRRFTGAASRVLKFGPGQLHHIAINNTGSPSSSFTIYDSTFAKTGLEIAAINTNGSSLGNINYDLPFNDGLFIVSVGNIGDITIVYE